MRTRSLVLAALALTALADPAAAASAPGAWQTFIRAGEFTALLARDDEVWGATASAGLFRWDRAVSRFDLVRREPGSITSNRLTALAIDRSGRLWVGSDGAGVSRRSADGERWDLVNLLDGLPSDTVWVMEAAGDTMWIGTSKGIALWNGREVTGSLPDGLTESFDTTFASASITGIVQLGDSLWLSTRRGIGLARLSTLLSDWRPANQGLASTDIEGLASDGAALFAHAAGEVYRWRVELDRWEVEPGAGVVHRLNDASGVVLAAGESGGFRWFQTAADSGWAALAGSPAAAPSAAEDPEISMAPDGRVFETLGETLWEEPASPGAWLSHPLPEGPPGNNLLQVAVDGPRVYVTTRTDGIGRFDGGWRIWPRIACVGTECDTSFINLTDPIGLLVDRTGRKWVASWSNALESFLDEPSSPEVIHHVIGTDLALQKRTWVVSAVADTSGRRWFGMDTPLKGDVDPIGLEVYDAAMGYVGNFNETNSTMSGTFVHGLAFTPNGRVWLGYDGDGLDYVVGAPDSDAFFHIDDTDGLEVRGVASYGDSVWIVTPTQLLRFGSSDNTASTPAETRAVSGGQAELGIKPLAIGPDGSVWIGTAAGLHVVRPGGAEESFDTSNSPIPGDEVRAVAVDPLSGVVWMTTPDGLARFDPGFSPPPAPPLPSLSARVYPNPAQLTGLGVLLRITGEAESYDGEVYDLSGRRLRRFRSAVNGALVWDGRDDDGHLVPPGLYFVRVEAGGRSAVARVALLR